MSGTENETPSWLSQPAVTEPVPAPTAQPPKTFTAEPNSAPPAATLQSAQSTPAPAEMTEADKENLRGAILFMRLANLGVSVTVIAHAVLFLISLPSPQMWVLGFYSACGGCLICCLETQLKFIRTIIALNFGFLFNPSLRFAYYLLMATMCYSFRDLFGRILAGCLVGIALYNTFVLIKYPAYRKMRDDLAAEEDKRIEGKLKERVRIEASKQMFASN
jgi:hypothetical protein